MTHHPPETACDRTGIDQAQAPVPPVVDATRLAEMCAQAAPAASAVDETRLAELWAQAFDEWLVTGRNGKPRPRATVRAYAAAWIDFRMSCPKSPWLVEPADIQRWMADMRRRALDRAFAAGLIMAGRRRTRTGLSEATQAQYLAAVSSFYSFCERYPLPGGREAGQPVRAVIRGLVRRLRANP